MVFHFDNFTFIWTVCHCVTSGCLVHKFSCIGRSVFILILCGRSFILHVFLVIVFNLQLHETSFLFFIFLFKPFIFTFKMAHLLVQLSVGIFTRKEFGDHFSDIWISWASSNLLESIFNFFVFAHFFRHFLHIELRPNFLYLILLSSLNFILVFIFISSFFSNCMLTFHSFNTFLQSLLFVTNAQL